MSVKGSWSRVKDKKAWDKNWDMIFKKNQKDGNMRDKHEDKSAKVLCNQRPRQTVTETEIASIIGNYCPGLTGIPAAKAIMKMLVDKSLIN